VIVFDMDGVLVDVTESYRETIRQTVQHFTGQEITRELITPVVGITTGRCRRRSSWM
jgi:phosphoglycolate phosphatase-like HAD superfamily hydrolase